MDLLRISSFEGVCFMHTSVIFLSCACDPGSEPGKMTPFRERNGKSMELNAGVWKKTSFLEANRTTTSANLEKKVSKNGILGSTVDS